MSATVNNITIKGAPGEGDLRLEFWREKGGKPWITIQTEGVPETTEILVTPDEALAMAEALLRLAEEGRA